MTKLLILAALLFVSSKTGISSEGTTTSPQQQNPQTGADKDPCEVLLSMLYPRLFSTKSHVLHEAFILSSLGLPLMSAKLSAKQIPNQS